MMASAAAPNALAHHALDKVAIIDVGSNSVRMVVYDGRGSVPLSIFNEKVQCALGAELATTGKLYAPGKESALLALARFVALMQAMQVSHCIVLATAAVREATDGTAFADTIRTTLSLNVEILSGEEEAALAGYGVLASVDNVDGVACDLGGGSLECAQLTSTAPGDLLSLPLGVLMLKDISKSSYFDAKQHSNMLLQTAAPLLHYAQGKTLYLIGGSFRALANLWMAEQHYPFRLSHQLHVDAAAFRSFLKPIAKANKDMLLQRHGITRKRAETLPYAAVILRRLIKLSGASHLCFSAQGIREGALYRLLVDDPTTHDPLLEASTSVARSHGGDIVFGEALANWLYPVFADAPRAQEWARIVHAACLLVTIPRYELSAERADSAFFDVLQAPLVAVSHASRLLIAAAVMVRYNHTAMIPLANLSQLHMADADSARARLLGMLISLGVTLSGGVQELLSTTRLCIKDGALTLHCDNDALRAGEVVEKRLRRAQDLWALLQEK